MKHPLSLEAFADWLGTLPADQAYRYDNSEQCAWCQYLRFIGFSNPSVGPGYWREKAHRGPEIDLPDGVEDVVVNGTWTFGAAHQRARALLTEQNATVTSSYRGT